LDSITPSDSILIAAPDGQLLYKKNETKKCVPASTLKLLTALTAIHHLGSSYRFRTEFYTDPDQNLKIKGYGDPLLKSEVLRDITDVLAKKIQNFRNLILDDTYFSHNIEIPDVGHSTNPYDAPTGALCVNFNTINFDRDQQGKIISAEPQTPMTAYAREKIRSLGLKRGRYTFAHDHGGSARYAGELLLQFLKERGVEDQGKIYLSTVGPEDSLVHTYRSRFTLEQVIKEMMEFSNNFMANQILIALGAHVYGPPGTLDKGLNVVSDYAKKDLRLENIDIVEGAGISRKNRITALDMMVILKHFKPYRYLLKRTGKTLFKTGTLKGIRTRVGYIESPPEDPYYFVIFLNSGGSDIDSLMRCIKAVLND